MRMILANRTEKLPLAIKLHPSHMDRPNRFVRRQTSEFSSQKLLLYSALNDGKL